jgi:Fe-S cluster biogenesis protein NfuA
VAEQDRGAVGRDDLPAVGDRIEVLLEASSSGGAVQRERAEELVGLVTDLYGAGIERMLDILDGLGRLDNEVLAALAEDPLVAGLLLVHGLHPHPLEQRVETALEQVRPFLSSQAADVELVGVGEDGVVRLRLVGSDGGCPSSIDTLRLAVEGAVENAAPEVLDIEIAVPPRGNGLISVDSLRVRLPDPPSHSSTPVAR